MDSSVSDISILPFSQHDLPTALQIQGQAYPAFLVEEAAAFRSRISLKTSYCLVAKRGETLLAYLLAHGWRGRSPPAVGTILMDEAPSEVLFIHDLAVSSAGRRSGIGERLVKHAFEAAARDGLRRAELIAVEGAADYWRRLGFLETAVSDGLRRKIESYGPRACWMTRDIAPNP